MSKLQFHTSDTDFVTENGQVLRKPVFAYQSWGKLNANRDNVILVCHALTGNSDAADWFSGLFSDNSFIDLKKHFVLCLNHLGSCYGSTGPWSVNPETGKPYQSGFPNLTIRDLAQYHIQFLNELKVHGNELVIGGSMGGMVALELSLLDERVGAACLLAMGKAHTAWAIGISHAQRQAIYADENWKEGYYSKGNPPAKGLSAARAMAMISYRSAQNYQLKFDRNYNAEKNHFDVESYLDYQGQKLVQRFDALSYIVLTKAMDTHDVSRGNKSFEDALQQLRIPVLVLGIDSDLLYPTTEQKELAQLIPQGRYAEISSVYGHDAFLIEFDQINRHLNTFINSIHLQPSALNS